MKGVKRPEYEAGPWNSEVLAAVGEPGHWIAGQRSFVISGRRSKT